MKHFNKFIIILLVIVIMATVFTSCKSDENIELNEQRLSESCEYVLASGTTENGDFLELVANTSKSFDGKSEVGVIKNNEWYINLSSDNPFVESNGAIKGADMDDFPSRYRLLNGSCFIYYDRYIWNFEKNINNFMLKNTMHMMDLVCVYDYRFAVDDTVVVAGAERENNWYNSVYLLDTNTMKLSEALVEGYLTDGRFVWETLASFSEGLFYVDLLSEGKGFYNEKGEKVIDLSKYKEIIVDRTDVVYLVFKNGQCKFLAKNDAGKTFEITIDKQGNVLSEKAI